MLALWVFFMYGYGSVGHETTPYPLKSRWWDGTVNGERVLALSNFRVGFTTATKRIASLRRQGYHAVQVIPCHKTQ